MYGNNSSGRTANHRLTLEEKNKKTEEKNQLAVGALFITAYVAYITKEEGITRKKKLKTENEIYKTQQSIYIHIYI